MVGDMGCSLKSPFMTLSFMALLVIPELKLSDRGLFDGKKFEFTDLFIP
ncbi:MAG: adenine deaminase C-terminal domain-containing protein [Bacteroidales bacterium]|jgi:adenine deaminase|nr:adenine deaminase C-terminal domain-containing protein [Bacteroidales bacterium]